MESEQFFLKWNNFENNLASGFADLLEREAMVDVTLAAEGKIVQAHKIILSICSSYFRNMFQANPCQHPIVVLKDVGYQELSDMLDFMYKGEANVRQQDLPSFLKLAETLKVKGLAGSQGEADENPKKRSCLSQISGLTKDSLSTNKEDEEGGEEEEEEEHSNDFVDKELMLKKKIKRSLSPFTYSDSKTLHPSQNIKLEIEECDTNVLRDNINNGGQNPRMKEERLSDNSSDSYENHPIHERLDVEKNPGPSTPDENSETMPQETILKADEYHFLESCFGGHLLVFGGYSFRRKSVRTVKSYWFCCKTKCPAKGILHSNGTFQVTNSGHNHRPDDEDIKKKEKLVELKKKAVQLNVSGHDLLDSLNIKENVKKHLSFIRTCRSRNKKQKDHHTNVPIYVGLNYKLSSSRIPSKEMVFYSGYLFRQDSVNRQKEYCKYWRCRVKNCRARAKTDEDGNLTILKPSHNHPPDDSGDATQEFKQTLKTGTSTLHKPVCEIKEQQNIKGEIMKKCIGKIKKNKERQEGKQHKVEEQLVSVIEDPALGFGPPTADSETFSLEKLMAETLGENYCVASEFGESLNLLKN